MGKTKSGQRPVYSMWFADLAATPGLTEAQFRVACRVGSVGLGSNGGGERLYFESLETLSAMTGVSRRTAQRALAKLVSLKLLRVARKATGRGHPTRYALRANHAEGVLEKERSAEKGCQIDDALSVDKGCQQDVTLSSEKGCHSPDTSSEERVSPGDQKGVKALSRKGVTQVARESLRILKNGADASAGAPGDAPVEPTQLDLAERRRMLKAQARYLERTAHAAERGT